MDATQPSEAAPPAVQRKPKHTILCFAASQLRLLTGDESLEIVEAQEGRVKRMVSLSSDAAARLEELHERGQLGSTGGFDVSSVRAVDPLGRVALPDDGAPQQPLDPATGGPSPPGDPAVEVRGEPSNLPAPLPEDVEAARVRPKVGRWWQLIFGFICMAMIANFQFSWTLFASPIAAKYHWARPAIQTAFTVFVLVESWLVPVGGWLADRYGPRVVVVAGGVLCAMGWGMSAFASSLPLLWIAYGIVGLGAGGVYSACVGNALKWFPERRGLAAAITTAGFGACTAATLLPMQWMINAYGYESTFLWFGIGQGAVILLLGLLLVQPDASMVAALPRPRAMLTHRSQFRLHQMLRTPVFWVMYAMSILVGAGGLIFSANLWQIAADFEVAKVPVEFLGWAPTAIILALFLDRIMNAITRPLFGWASDRIGREMTMFLAFGTQAISIVLLSQLGSNPVAFVVLSGLVFFGSGEIYSVFPAICTDTFGWKHAAANAGALYTAKSTAALFVPLAVSLVIAMRSWHAAVWLAAAMNGLAAIMALVVLKPLRQRMLAPCTPPDASAGAERAAEALSEGQPQAVSRPK